MIFDFCPPGKRHGVDLEMLSGGEKTMAALSFIFALVQVKQPPLLIMDEIDAFLDKDNVRLASTFLSTNLNMFSKSAHKDTQVILVSHKENFAAQFDSLVGVCMLK
jgi:chromosome segregation protein